MTVYLVDAPANPYTLPQSHQDGRYVFAQAIDSTKLYVGCQHNIKEGYFLFSYLHVSLSTSAFLSVNLVVFHSGKVPSASWKLSNLQGIRICSSSGFNTTSVDTVPWWCLRGGGGLFLFRLLISMVEEVIFHTNHFTLFFLLIDPVHYSDTLQYFFVVSVIFWHYQVEASVEKLAVFVFDSGLAPDEKLYVGWLMRQWFDFLFKNDMWNMDTFMFFGEISIFIQDFLILGYWQALMQVQHTRSLTI